jgi:hypothetical protein
VSQCKECTSEFCVEFRKNVPRRAHQKSYKLKRGASRLLNTLEEKLCRESIERKKFMKFCRAFQVGIKCKSAQKNSSSSSEIREVSEEKTLTKLLNTLEEDLCKECTRPTLRRSVERQPVKGIKD